jgi:hypothetical protein
VPGGGQDNFSLNVPMGSGSSLPIAQGVDGIEDKAATQKYSAIDKLFCSNLERTAEIQYSSTLNKSRNLLA